MIVNIHVNQILLILSSDWLPLLSFLLLFKKLSDLFSLNEFDIISENWNVFSIVFPSLLQIVGDEKKSQTFKRNKYWKNAKILPKMFHMKGNQYRILTSGLITVRFLMTTKEKGESHALFMNKVLYLQHNKMTALAYLRVYQNFTLLLSKPKMVDLSPFLRENIYPLNHA